MLLISMLRSVGVDASLSLLQTDGPDVAPAMPGLEAFNHVIVYVPEPSPLWIDPTLTTTVAGELPVQIYGRRTLIVGSGRNELTLLPPAKPQDHEYRETRVIELAEIGPPKVRESFEGRGGIEQFLRHRYGDPPEHTFRDQMKDYVQRAYGSEKLVSAKRSGPRGKLQIELAIEEAHNTGFTSEVEASVHLRAGDLFQWMPDELKKKTDRKTDLELPLPHVAQLQYLISIPAGFKLKKPIATEALQIGPARFSMRSEFLSENVLSVGYVFDSGPAKYSAAEVRRFQEELLALWPRLEQRVELIEVGAQHAAAGRIREAMASYQNACMSSSSGEQKPCAPFQTEQARCDSSPRCSFKRQRFGPTADISTWASADTEVAE